MSFLQGFGKALGGKGQALSGNSLYACKNRFAMLGTVGSGKSTVAASLILTTQTLSSDMPGYRCRVLEGTSNILSDASLLRQGHFPQKTVAFQSYAVESGLLMAWDSFLGEKRVQIPICDIAGEDIQMMIQQYSKNISMEIGNAAYSAAQGLVNYVKDADGFIVVLPASKALIKGAVQLEKESSDIFVDPDVNLARILSEVIDHKERTRGKPIRGIAAVVTKWDLMAPYAANMGMDITTPQGLKEFMDVCFPATSQQIKACRLANVRFFPSFVELERDSQGNPKKWQDDTPTILCKDRRKISYSEKTYIDLIEFMHTFAT